MQQYNPFMTMPYEELIALQRMCQAACFGQTSDSEIPSSPACGQIYTKVLAAIMAHEYATHGATAVLKWLTWLKIDATRDEWKFVVTMLRADARFSHWSEYTKHAHITLAMQPFELTTEQIQAILAEVDNEAN